MVTVDEALAQGDPTQFAITLGDMVFSRYLRDGFAALTPAERVVYCVGELEKEVNNGGFDQFFVNSAGDTTAETIEALKVIGAAHTATLVQRAAAAVAGGVPPVDRDERTELMADLDDDATDALEALDEEFLRYVDDLTGLLRAFVVAHKGDIRRWDG